MQSVFFFFFKTEWSECREVFISIVYFYDIITKYNFFPSPSQLMHSTITVSYDFSWFWKQFLGSELGLAWFSLLLKDSDYCKEKILYMNEAYTPNVRITRNQLDWTSHSKLFQIIHTETKRVKVREKLLLDYRFVRQVYFLSFLLLLL